MPLRLDSRATGFEDAFGRLVEARRGAASDVGAQVAEILADDARARRRGNR